MNTTYDCSTNAQRINSIDLVFASKSYVANPSKDNVQIKSAQLSHTYLCGFLHLSVYLPKQQGCPCGTQGTQPCVELLLELQINVMCLYYL